MKAVGILVPVGTCETSPQIVQIIEIARNVSQQRCSNWRDGSDLTD
jgi:hypothetical protein